MLVACGCCEEGSGGNGAVKVCIWSEISWVLSTDVSIQLEKIKSITLHTIVKKGGKKFNLTFLMRWLLTDDVKNVVEAMALLKYGYKRNPQWCS